ncbi:stage V sporulation protein D [Bacillus sp. REN10]|uniref:stage V sporulation protein D n=1 Tax=Bacillus sp. REN10 TaxID=2782541 RepID=UPI00193C4AE7|nr:stage V sporulation protein D [Bacillus sp. REN10]
MKRVSAVTVRKRLIFVLLSGLMIFSIIGVRLAYVQFVLGDDLTNKAKDLWSRNIPFEPERGKIVDRNGVALAENKSAPTVYVVPRQIEDPMNASKQLAAVLNMSSSKAYKDITKQTSMVRIHPEGRKISFEKAEQVRSLGIKGVYIAEDSKRHYPFGKSLAHVLGFAGIDNQGLMGLEAFYNKELNGQKGAMSFFSDAKGKRMPQMPDGYTPPSDGLDLKLTIDSKIQTIMERELDVAEAKYQPDGAIAIAMNPNNGEVLAMASRPSFYPEKFQEASPEVFNRNLPIWSTYEPGSTFKIITLAAALEEKKVDLHKDHFHDPGFVSVGGARLKCWKRGGHGHQSFLEVVENSCNPGFVELGERLGKEKLFSYVRSFGFGEKTGIDLQGEAKGLLFKLDRVGPVEQATTAFGQGVSVTPIQQVAAVSAAVNGGMLYQPYVAKELVDPVSGEVVKRKTPIAKRRVISEETSKQIRFALESVVAQGTGRNAFVEGYRVGGKTGTAQKAKDGRYLKNNHIVSFIGVAPADDPQLVIYTAIDNPKGTVQFGGTVAAPIVGKIMEDSLQVLNVKPREKQLEKEVKWDDPEIIKVPNLIGLSKKELSLQLENLKLEVLGSGQKVVQQAPMPGTKVEIGSTIRVYLN